MQTDVLFGMLLSMLYKGRVTSVELSLKYEISKRTVLRYIDILGAAGVPVMSKCGRNGGFYLAENYTLERMYFSKEELACLIECVGGMKGLFPDKINESLQVKLGSLKYSEKSHILASDTIFIDAGPWGDIKSYRGKMTVLEKAVKNSECLLMVYHDISGVVSERVIHPYTLVFKTGIWYIYAYCTLRNDFRLFKIGRIANISSTGEVFEKQKIDTENLPYSLNWFENEDNINVVLEVSQGIKSEVEEWLSFENVRENKDGKIYAFARLPHSGLVQKLLSFGGRIKVIEPQFLKNELLETISGIEELYKNEK